MIQNKYNIKFTKEADLDMQELMNDNSKKIAAKAVFKSLKFMNDNLRHHSLNTHKYDDFCGPDGEDIFESYAQNNTPGAYRIFWYYGPGKEVITILRITPHP
jgi:mRNA-degrading endonuclease RelE of RelBE toxin-antitoxin system